MAWFSYNENDNRKYFIGKKSVVKNMRHQDKYSSHSTDGFFTDKVFFIDDQRIIKDG